MKKVIKFAILGCGHIGKKHAELIQKFPDAKLIAVIEPIDSITLQLSNFGVAVFSTLDEFISARLEVDVVNICTPNGLHASQAIKCLNNNINVVIEKPIALTSEDAKAISVAAIASGKNVFPVVQNRYSSTVKWLKEIVSDNRLGEVFIIQLNCFWNRDERYYKKGGWRGTLELDGGPLFTQFSHFIDVLLWVFGDVKNINTKFFNFNHQDNTEFEDSGIVTFDLESGGAGSINYSTSAFQSNFESSITVIAQNGTLKIGGQYMNCLEYCQINGTDQPVLDENELVNDYGSYKGSASNHQEVIENVIKTLKGSEKPDVTVQDGISVVEVISNIYKNRNLKEVALEKFRLV